MSSYSGKTWESDFRESFKGTKLSKGIMRLHDVTNGFAGCNNPYDFLVFSYPNLFCFELKAVQDRRLDFAKIRPNQVEGLSNWGENKGTIAGVLVNFYTYSQIFFVPIQLILKLKESGKRSINLDFCNEYCYKVDGGKKRTRFRINVLKTIEDLRDFKLKELKE